MKKLSKNLHLAVAALFLVQIFFMYKVHITMKDQLISSSQNIKTKITLNKKKLKELMVFEANLEDSKKRVKEVASKIELVQRQLPSAISDTEVLDFISTESSNINIQDSILQPKEEELNGFYFAKKYKFEGTGTFLQFVVLFEQIYTTERLFNIDEVTFSQTDELFQKGRFHLINMNTTIESFRYNTDYKESTGIDEIESKYSKSDNKAGNKKGKKK